MSIVVLGNLLLEFSTRLKTLPQTGQHQTLDTLATHAAGSGNTIIVGQRLGLAMHPLAEVGSDVFGTQIIAEFEAEGVITDDILRLPGPTTTVFNMVEEIGQNTMFSFPGAKGGAILHARWAEIIQGAQALFLSGWTYQNMNPEMAMGAVICAATHSVPIVFDPGPESRNIPDEWLHAVLKHTSLLLLTEDEARDVLRVQDEMPLKEMATLLHQTGPELVVIKRGAQGICISSGDTMERQPAFPVTVQDTTGAGDTVAAAVMLSYLRHDSLIEMATLANAAGAAAVQKQGAGRNLPYKHEIQQVLERFTSFSNLL